MKRVILYLILSLIPLSQASAAPDQSIPNISSKVYEDFIIKDCILTSSKGRKYKIFIATPTQKAPKNSYNVLYMLDGNKQFPMLLNLYKKMQNPPLIVAIGYDTNLAYNTINRTYDYTPKAKGKKYSKGGGAEEFYQFIEQKIKPLIASKYPINHQKQVFFGHSFGGLFGLYVMFNHSDCFSDYIIASPSLWWGDGVVIPLSKPFIKSHPSSIVITLGGLENHPSKSPMNAQNLALELSEQNQNVMFIEFEGKTHGGVIEDALKTALKVLD